MKKRLEELKDNIQIDENALERECVDHPHLYAEIGEMCVEAKTNATRLKEHIDYLKADLSARVRSDPGNFGIAKVTEGSIAAAVATQKELVAAIQEHTDAQEISDHFQVLLAAAEHRRSMLNNVVSLWENNYYSEVVATRPVRGTDVDVEQKIINARKRKAAKREATK